MTSSEERLTVQAAVEGDELAFRQLYESEAPRLKKILIRMTRNEWDAEDLLSETFIHIFKKLHLFRGDSRFATWAHRIAVNNFYMSVRKRKLETVDLEQPIVGDLTLRDTLSNEATGIETVDLARLRELPPGFLRALILREYYGFEHREIAKITGRSAGTSKSQFAKAKIAARKLMNA
jgi:RNA polymerase sigma factor (sigma-70 family)